MFVRNQSVLWTELDGQLMLMDIETGAYYQVEGIGGAIWQMLETPRSEAEIVEAILATYRVGKDECVNDIRIFLAKLVESKVVISQNDALEAATNLAE